MITKVKKHQHIILFFLFLLVGIIVRGFWLGQVPMGINQDEAMAAVDAKALLEYGTDRLGMRFPVHFTAWGWAQMSVLLSYMMIPFIKFFGFTTFAIRLPLFLISTMGMIFLYLLIKKIFNKNVALVVFALTAINPWHIIQSRWSVDCNLFPHLFVIATYLLLIGLEKSRYLFISMIFYGLCLYSYGVSVYSVPLFLAVLGLYLWRTKQVSFGKIFLCGIIFGLISLPELLTMFINLVGIDSIKTPFFTIPYFSGTVRSKDILITNFSLQQLFLNIWACLKSSFLQSPDLFHNTIPLFGTIYHISIPFSVVGMVSLFRILKQEKNCQKKIGYLALASWFLMGLWIGMITFEVNVNRINIIHYSMIILTAIGIICVVNKWRILFYPLVTVYSIAFLFFTGIYFTNYASDSRIEFHQDYLDAVVVADSLPIEHFYVSTNEHPQTLEILMQYVLSTDALYYQQKTNVQNGKEQLLYSERYQFHYLGDEYVDWDLPNTAYLVTEEEWHNLENKGYKVYDYGRYRLYIN